MNNSVEAVAREIVDNVLFHADPDQAVKNVIEVLTRYAAEQVQATWEEVAIILQTRANDLSLELPVTNEINKLGEHSRERLLGKIWELKRRADEFRRRAQEEG